MAYSVGKLYDEMISYNTATNCYSYKRTLVFNNPSREEKKIALKTNCILNYLHTYIYIYLYIQEETNSFETTFIEMKLKIIIDYYKILYCLCRYSCIFSIKYFGAREFLPEIFKNSACSGSSEPSYERK